MELDWCSDENLSSFSKFNENSIINKEKKKSNDENLNDEKIEKILNLNDCFSLNLNTKNNENILTILNYLSFISNYLRTLMRNKSNKFKEIKELNLEEYDSILKNLDWLILASNAIKNFFSNPVRRDNSYDPSNIKLFKTSSYKFCNFKESCSIHKNKQSKCDKNHFVFDMIINDIIKLKESITIIGFDNINWILNNKFIKIIYNIDTKKYLIENIEFINNYIDDNDENQFIIDKTLIFKSFDVISYVLNKMYEESIYFLNNSNQTILITI
jgi:hypothetical protein